MKHRPVYTLSGALFLLLTGCGESGDGDATKPPPVVETIVLKSEAIPNSVELPGRIEAVRSAEVRARTNGIVEARLFEEGSIVRKGQPLFRIDARDYRAQVEQAQGALQRATAARGNAASVVRRYDPLVAEKAISGQEYDAARSELVQAEAQVTEARAALDRARLQLSYTTVTAPIAGRIGQAEVTEGALVNGSQATLMTRIDEISPVYAVFSESNAAILDTIQQARQGGFALPSISSVTVRLILENGASYPVTGKIDFTGASVDPSTGSQTIRARFDNVDGLLAPGQFVRGNIQGGTLPHGLAVPARAVQMQGGQAQVFVLGKDGTVISRMVTLGNLMGDRWVIRSGLQPGERLIVDGWQKVRPGQKAQAATTVSGKVR